MIHICFSKRGKHPECKLCKIEPYCSTMIDEFERSISTKFYGHDDAFVKDVISETIEELIKSIEKFQGNTEAKFRSYLKSLIRHIYSNKIYDLKRREKISKEYVLELYEIHVKSKDELNYEIDISLKEHSKDSNISEDEFEEFLEIILKKLTEEGYPECGERIIEFYRKVLIQEVSRKEIAKERNEKENTYNQNLGRCLKRLKKLLNEMNLELKDFI